MSERSELAFYAAQLDSGVVEAVHRLHLAHRFRLTTATEPVGVAHLDDVPEALVSELLRLARFGALIRATAEAAPDKRVGDVVRAIDNTLRRAA